MFAVSICPSNTRNECAHFRGTPQTVEHIALEPVDLSYIGTAPRMARADLAAAQSHRVGEVEYQTLAFVARQRAYHGPETGRVESPGHHLLHVIARGHDVRRGIERPLASAGLSATRAVDAHCIGADLEVLQDGGEGWEARERGPIDGLLEALRIRGPRGWSGWGRPNDSTLRYPT